MFRFNMIRFHSIQSIQFSSKKAARCRASAPPWSWALAVDAKDMSNMHDMKNMNDMKNTFIYIYMYIHNLMYLYFEYSSMYTFFPF